MGEDNAAMLITERERTALNRIEELHKLATETSDSTWYGSGIDWLEKSGILEDVFNNSMDISVSSIPHHTPTPGWSKVTLPRIP